MKRFLSILSVFLLFLLAGGEIYAQPIPQWINRFDAEDSIDVAKDIVIDSQGNTYITGYSNTLLGLLTDIVTISYDPNGNTRWRSDYSTLLWDEGAAITLDKSERYVYITGFVGGLLNVGLADYVIIKYNATTGQQQWLRTYNFGILGDDRATDIAVDNQNNPVITGYSQGFLLILTPHDYATVKYDTAGNQQWASRYNGTANDEDRAYAIVVDSNNNVIVTGESVGSGSSYDYATVKYNSAGTQQWASRYNGPGNDEDRAYAIVVDSNENVIVTGSSRSNSSAGSEDYATVKYAPNGAQQWSSRYNGPANDEDRAYAIVVDSSDNPVVTGESMGSGTNFDYATVKYNSAGSQQWASRYNGPGNNEDRAYAIVVDSSDNVYVTGSSRSGSAAGTEDYATLKYNPGGSQQWVTRYNGTGNNEDRAYAIVVDNSGGTYVTGSSRNGPLFGDEDYLTIKYFENSSPVLIISSEVPVNYSLYQNYPNPFNPKTNIRFDVPSQSIVKITVYNVTGTQVAVLVNNKLSPGKYEVQWDAEKYSSGIYFYRITMGDVTQTRKMILIK